MLKKYKEAAKCAGLWKLLEGIAFGYSERTPNGFHLLYKCSEIAGNTKLAQATEKKTLIETRGEGGFIIVAPSYGKVNLTGSYELKAGGFDSIVTITQEERRQLHILAQTFDEMPRQEHRSPSQPVKRTGGTRPGDEFIRSTTWEEVLEPHGWTKVFQRGETTNWCRPGKKGGISATTNHNGSDLLYVFSTSTEFDSERGYNRFSAYTLLNHNGDFRAATRALGGDGYGAKQEPSSMNEPPDWHGDDPGYDEEQNNQYSQHGQSNEERPKPSTPEFKPKAIKPGFLAGIANLPKRQFIMEGLLLRGYLTAALAPGGVGKSVFSIALAISVASGKPIMGIKVLERTNTLILNNEDDKTELERRIAGVMQRHGITEDDVKGRLFYKSGYGSPDVLARKVNALMGGVTQNIVERTETADDLVEFCKEKSIGGIFCDPLVSLHDANENDNGEMERAIGVIKSICFETKAAMLISHHIPKGGADSEAHAGNADASRGAGAVKDGCRIVLTLARMSKATGEDIGMDASEFPRMIRLDDAKKNYSLIDAEAMWFRMDSINLLNDDWVGVPSPKNLNPDFEAASKSKGQHVKWTAASVAEALERIMNGKSERKWADIRQRFMNENGIKDSVANGSITLVSQEQSQPTHIKTKGGMDVHYWLEKRARSWFIQRREMN